MNTTELKQLLDACFTAKRIVETLPELPDHMKPRHIHVLDAIYETKQKQEICQVSDVCHRLNITMPSITKLIQELETRGLVEKYHHPQDKRVTLLNLTEEGLTCVRRHVLDFHSRWAEKLQDIDRRQVEETIAVIEKLRHTMPGIEEDVYGKK